MRRETKVLLPAGTNSVFKVMLGGLPSKRRKHVPFPIVQDLVVETRLDGDRARPWLNLHFIGEAAAADV